MPEHLTETQSQVDLLRAFSRALSPHSNVVRLIDANNDGTESRLWDSALGGTVFAVHLAHRGRFHTLALDFDAKGTDPDLVDEQARAAQSLLARAGISSVLVASGPTGGRHLLATIGGRGLSPRAMEKLARRLKALGLGALDLTPLLNPKTGSIRPPLSTHRAGGRSTILDITIPEALAILEHPQNPSLFVDLADALPSATIHSTLLHLESAPAPSREYRSGSEEIQAVATRLARSGEAFSAFKDHIEDGGALSPGARATVQRHRQRNDLHQWLKRSWESAEVYLSDEPSRRAANWDDTEVIDSWFGSVNRSSIPGDGTRRVAMTLHATAQEQGRAMVGMSARTAAERSGVSPATAARALLRLTEMGVIEVAGDSTAVAARRYRLLHAAAWNGAAGETPPSPFVLGGVRSQTVSPAARLALNLEADIWERGRLGESARLVYEALAEASDTHAVLSLSELSAKTELARRTVSTHLRALGSAGLAHRLGGGLWEVEYRDPEDVALDLGILPGGAEARRRMHARERRDDKIRQTLYKLERIRLHRGVPADLHRVPTENHSQIRTLPVPLQSITKSTDTRGPAWAA